MIVGSIPSPPSGVLHIGPLAIHAYGLMIALGVIAGVWLMSRRLVAAGAGTAEDVSYVAVRAVIAGVIGSRLYHVVTDWSAFSHHLSNIPKIWQGGLGIPGGLLGGIVVAMIATRRRGVASSAMFDAAAPAVALSQAIGRWGNWWNQELFGRPTTLPWGLRIDADRAPQFPPGTTFHPTFLYESLWNFALCGLLILIGRRFALRPGRLLAMYLFGYFTGRFWVEGLRIDPAKSAGGLRLNQWVALVVAGAALLYLVADWLRHRTDVINPSVINPASADPDVVNSTGADPDVVNPTGADPADIVFDDVDSTENGPVADPTDDESNSTVSVASQRPVSSSDGDTKRTESDSDLDSA